MNKLGQLQEVHRYIGNFEKMQRWMNNDLRKSTILGKANLLVAMGLFNYVEILGAFYRFSSPARRFNYVVNELLPKPYKNVCARLDRLTIKGAYDTLRCGMTHEYLVKTNSMKNSDNKLKFTIFGSDNEEEFDRAINRYPCGLILINKGNLYHLSVINARFIHDLDFAFEIYKDRLNKDVKGYRKYFLKRSEEVGLKFIQ